MALLVGRAVPSGVAFLAEANMVGGLYARPLNTSVLDKAREQGISTIFSSR
jgi:hypothetical protein